MSQTPGPPQPHSARLVFSPAVNDITEMAAYVIHRSVDGSEFEELTFCAVIRDLLGAIIGIDNCTTPIVPSSADKQLWREMPVTYVDTTVAVNHEYCYAVQAFPLGNNMSNNQGPPSAISSQVCITIIAKATTPVLQGQVINNAAVLLDWTQSTVEDSIIDHYEIWKNQDGGAFFHLTNTLTGDTLEYEDDAVATNHVYMYYVVAVPVQGLDSNPSNIVTEALAQFRTSLIYPIEVFESMTVGARSLPSAQFTAPLETLTVNGTVISGVLAATLVTYGNWPPETLTAAGSMISGTLTLGLLTYTNWPFEDLTAAGSVISGTLTFGLIQYTNWPFEDLTVNGSVISGTLT